MSQLSVLNALEIHLATVEGALDTAYENVDFAPTAGVPYQSVHLMPMDPVDPAYGSTLHREQGIFQVTLCYPAAASGQTIGSGAARLQAERIRAAFVRGTSLVADGITVVIDSTPAIGPAYRDQDRFCVPVSIRYFAHVSA
jgi:hypothetical protein